MSKRAGSANGTPKKHTKKKDGTDELGTRKKAGVAKFRDADDDAISLLSLDNTIDSDSDLEPGSPSMKSLILALKAETEMNNNDFGLFKVEVRSRFDAIDTVINNLNRSKIQPEKLAKATKAVSGTKPADTNLEEELARQVVQNTNLNTEIMKQKKENALQDTEIRRLKGELQKCRDRDKERKLRLEESYHRMSVLRYQLAEVTKNNRNKGGYAGDGYAHHAPYPATRSRSTFPEQRGYRGSKMQEMSAEYGNARHERQEYYDEHRSSQKRRSRSPAHQSKDKDKRRRQGQDEDLTHLRPTESKIGKSTKNEGKLRRPEK